MAATLGNKYYKLRSKDGRNKIFENSEDLNTEIEKYFHEKSESFINKPDIIKSGDLAGENIQIKIDDFPTKEELAIYLGFAKWESLKNYKEYTEDFLEVITWAETVIYNWKFKMASVGSINANIIARDLGISDKQDVKSYNENINYNSEITDDRIEEIKNKLNSQY
ncbi:MAG: terminase small subunit [Myroides sp.]